MNRCVFLGVFLFFFCHVNAFEIGWNIYTYFITTPDGKNMTLYITPESEITIQGKAYMPFSGYFTNNTEENYVENLIMLRRDGAQYFCYDSKTESEHLMFDFGLQKGDSYIDGFNNIEYEVTDVRDTLLYEQNLQLIELQSKGGEGKRDIWVESIGSIYKGILPTNDYCKEMHLLINEYNEEPLDCLYRFYPNNQYIKTADMDITYLQWEKELETDEDWEEYMAWYNAPTDLNAEFSGDTLHVWGRLRASGGLYPYAACEIQGDMVSLCFFSNVYLEGICIDEIDTRIPGFQKGEYLVNLINKTEELECAGTITAQEPSPFLEGNPIWVYKYEHLSRGTAWKDEVCYGCFVDTNDKKYNYYFLGGQKEIEGKVYTMMGEVKNDGDGELTVSRWLPVREENGIVYAFTDSLPGLIGYDYLEPPYLQQGNECVLYNFNAEIGDLLYPQKDYTKVESYGTYQLMDGSVCRVLKTTVEDFNLYEKLGYLHDCLYYGIMDPPSDLIISIGDVFATHLNAYYQNDMMLYKAPDTQEGLCVNDTCWTRDDGNAYVRSYKVDPRQEEVFSYIRQLQKGYDPVTFTADQVATIILPVAPDASKGKYYRLDRVEDRQIIFEQELQPQAHVPYIIVPNKDFSINLSALDLAGCYRDTVSVDDISFIGSYVSETFDYPDGFYIDFIDITPDCRFEESCVIGALRAYLLVRWDDPYNQGGTRVPPMNKLEIILHDYETGVEDVNLNLDVNHAVFDLQGRKVAKQRKGIYIKEGKKVLIK